VCVTPLDDPGNLLGGAGQGDGVRLPVDAAFLRLVRGVARRIAGQDRAGAEDGAQLALDRFPGSCRGTGERQTAATLSASTGARSRSTFMNSRIHSGWSGHARADTITPSTTAAPSTNSPPAVPMSGSSAG
jgi:hypothetical protein